MASRIVRGVALITGAASGIGKDTAFSFAESGARHVVFADQDESGAHEAALSSNKYATNADYSTSSIKVDVTDLASVQVMVDRVIRDQGRIDYFVHSAGIGSQSFTPVSELSIAEFDEVMGVNMKGTLLCNRAVLKAMGLQEPLSFEGRHGQRDLGRGCIVNVGSVNCLGALPGKLPYTASKHGVAAITKTAALETGRLGIRVNLVCPSWVVGPMTDREKIKNPQLEGMIQKLVPCGRMAMPDEISDAIVFLCSPAASYISGMTIVIDSGLTLTVRFD
ncbi:MAG: hypothetical protein M1820_009638 [Bogoriella megaspora]|nr:MAG: hypothetical protein M1820_009638 [Bogoriella megaspora]